MSTKTKINWSDIYDKESGKLLAVCRKYVNDIQIAEDIVHDSFMKAIENAESYKGIGAFEGWLKRIVLNTTLDYLRQNKGNNFTDIEDLQLADENNQDKEVKHISKNLDNFDFSQNDLLETIEMLPTHHKLVFNLFVIDGLTHKEISKTLNIEINTSKSHLARARKKIQELLIEKANEMKRRKEKKRKKALVWLPLMGANASAHPIDRIFQDAFSNSTLPNPIPNESLKLSLQNAKPIKIKSTLFTKKSDIYWSSGITGVVLISIICYSTSTEQSSIDKQTSKTDIKQSSEYANPRDTSVIINDKIKSDDKQSNLINTGNKTCSTDKNKDSYQNKSENDLIKDKKDEDLSSLNTSLIEKIKQDSAKQTEKVVVRKQVVAKKNIKTDESTLP